MTVLTGLVLKNGFSRASLETIDGGYEEIFSETLPEAKMSYTYGPYCGGHGSRFFGEITFFSLSSNVWRYASGHTLGSGR